jgi:hypothetical protein
VGAPPAARPPAPHRTHRSAPGGGCVGHGRPGAVRPADDPVMTTARSVSLIISRPGA